MGRIRGLWIGSVLSLSTVSACQTPPPMMTPTSGSGAIEGKRGQSTDPTQPIKPFSIASASGELVVSTYAGDGTAGSADGPALQSQFFLPRGVAVDKSGNVYVADSYNFLIRKISPEGVVTTIAGQLGEFGTSVRFMPSCLEVDGIGNIYIGAHTTGNLHFSRVYKISPDGAISAFANLPGSTEINDIEIDKRNGNIFVSDSGVNTDDRVWLIGPNGGSGTVYAGVSFGYIDGPRLQARFGHISDIAIDSNGDILVADTYNQVIRKISTDGRVSTWTSCPNILGMKIDSNNNLFASTKDGIYKFAPDGTSEQIAGSDSGFADGPALSAKFSYVPDLTLDEKGTVFVVDGCRVRKVGSSPSSLKVSLIDQVGEKEVFDGEHNVYAEVQTVNPVIAVTVPGNESGNLIDWKDRVSFSFSPRKDGTTPAVDETKELYDASKNTVYYPIPLKQESILYMGDQWVEVTIDDPLKGTTTKRIPITIGHKTVISGIPGQSTTAYKVLSGVSLPVTQVPQGQPVKMDLPDGVDPNTIVPVETNSFFAGTSDLPPEQWVAPVQTAFILPLLPEAQVVVAGVAIVFGTALIIADKEYNNLKEAAENATRAYVDTHIGLVEISDDVWTDMAVEEQFSDAVSRALAIECLQAMDSPDGSEFEYWTRANGGLTGYAIFHKRNQLFSARIEGTDELVMKGFRVPRLDLPGGKLWPANPLELQKQWGDIVKNIMRYRPDYNNSRRAIWGNNWAPTYKFHHSGRINEIHKPYTIGTNAAYRVDDPFGNHAVPNGAAVVAEPPVFRNNGLRDSHFEDHDQEFTSKPKGKKEPASLLYTNSFEYQSGAQEMLKGEFRGPSDYYIRKADLLPGAGDGSRGDVVLFRGSDDARAVWSYDGYIRTYHKLDEGRKGFEAIKKTESFNFY